MNTILIAYLPIIFLFIFLAVHRKQVNTALAMKLKRKNGENEMLELAKRLIGKDILANTVIGGNVDGILKEVTDNSMVIEKNGKEEFVNLDYVVRLREYPKGKNGKRKAFVVDA